MRIVNLILCVVIAALSISACATRTPEREAELASMANRDLICEDEAACRKMWTKAALWVKDNSGGYRSVNTELNRITVWCSFVRSDAYYTAYVIERVPLEDGKSRLTLEFGPQSTTIACAPMDTLAAEADFKNMVLGEEGVIDS